MNVVRHPLSWYADRVAAGDSFTSLLYGDGEFTVMSGALEGETYTSYQEVVTVRMRKELTRAFKLRYDPNVLFGTDENILNYRTYAGGDADSFKPMGAVAERVLARLPKIDWVDGTVWDAASQHGRLGPFLRALRTRPVVLVGNPGLTLRTEVIDPVKHFNVPTTNAYASLDDVTRSVLSFPVRDGVYLLCCGLGAVPLAARLHGKIPGAAVLDVGGTFDVFARIGAERGWREAVYGNRLAYDRLIARHLGE